MNFKTIFLITTFLCTKLNQLSAQNFGFDAFSSCSSLSHSNFAALNNPAELITAKTTLSYSICNPYGLPDLYTSGLNIQTSTQNIGMGLTWQNQGNPIYQFNKFGLCTGLKPMKEISIGLNGYMEYFSIRNYRPKKNADMDISICAQLHPKMKSCFIIRNIFNYQSNKKEVIYQNQTVVWGMSYSLEKRINILIEIEKSRLGPINLKSAISIHKDSIFKLNISSAKGGKQLGLGIGLKKQKTEFGFAFTAHIILGFSTCLSIAYEIKS